MQVLATCMASVRIFSIHDHSPSDSYELCILAHIGMNIKFDVLYEVKNIICGLESIIK